MTPWADMGECERRDRNQGANELDIENGASRQPPGDKRSSRSRAVRAQKKADVRVWSVRVGGV